MRSSPRRERGEGLARRHIDERGGRDALVEDDERAGSPVWALSHERRRARSEYRADDQELESHSRMVLSPASHHQANPPASAEPRTVDEVRDDRRSPPLPKFKKALTTARAARAFLMYDSQPCLLVVVVKSGRALPSSGFLRRWKCRRLDRANDRRRDLVRISVRGRPTILQVSLPAVVDRANRNPDRRATI